METRANHALVGAFVLAAIAALVGFVVWISKAQFNQEFDFYDVVFEGAVNGLSEGGEVRFNGIKVGEVVDLGLDPQDPNNVIAEIRVEDETPIHQDSTASLELQGITGVTFIQIDAGTSSLPLLKDVTAQGRPRILTERTQLEELFAGGQGVIEASSEALTRINAFLSSENMGHVARILENIETITETASRPDGMLAETEEALEALREAGKAMEVAAVSIDAAGRDFEEKFEVIASDMDLFMESADSTVRTAQRVLEDTGGSISELSEAVEPGIEDVMNELAAAARDMRVLVNRLDGVAEELERDPREFVLGDVKPFED